MQRKIVERETKFQEIPYILYTTNAAGNYEELKEIIAKEGFTDIVMMGGDGTTAYRWRPSGYCGRN
jgi:diacylglycerol kinase (ATP)